MKDFKDLFPQKKPLIGMIHLLSLPSYSTHPGMSVVIERALKDLHLLQRAGFDGVLVENDNDQPHQIGVTPVIKKAFTLVMERIVKEAVVPVGMEIIYDMLATIEIAHIVHADFVRLDVFVDNVQTKWGQIMASSKEVILLKHKLKASDLLLLTDIQVKHAQMLDKKSLEQSATEAQKEGSNALVITGDWTGHAPSIVDCKKIQKMSSLPVLVGSGVSKYNARELFQIANGAIVGTSIKTNGYIDLQKAKDLVNEVKKIRSEL